MRKVPFEILIFFLIPVISTDRTIVCSKPPGQPMDSIVNCFIRFREIVCLLCPVAAFEQGLTWYAANEERPIFRDGNRINRRYASVSVNECGGSLYSLKISNIYDEHMEGKYTCKREQTTLANFRLQIQVVSIDDIKFCMDSSGQASPSVNMCTCGFNETVCLICPTSKDVPGLTWNKEGETSPISRGNYIVNSHYTTLRVNECDENHFSLKIPYFDVEHKNGKYVCKQKNNVLAKFLLQIQGSVW